MIHRFSSQAKVHNMIGSQMQPSFRSDVEQHEPLLKVHDPQSNDMAFAMRVAREIIYISGADVYIYPRTPNSYDNVWEEDADPTYLNRKTLKAYFAPQPTQKQLTPWGVDIENKTTVIFFREDVIKTFGQRMIIEDDIIELPFNTSRQKLDKFRVLNAFDSGQYRYTWLYYSCLVENITNDVAVDVDVKARNE